MTQKKNPAGFNSAQVNGGRRIITGSTRTQKKKRSSYAYICIYYLPVCYCFAIPCCPIAFPAVLLRESCGLYMYACMGKLSKNLDAAFSQTGLHRQLFPEIVRWASCLFEINVYTFVCPHQHGEDGGLYQIVFGWGFFFFGLESALDILSDCSRYITSCPAAPLERLSKPHVFSLVVR